MHVAGGRGGGGGGGGGGGNGSVLLKEHASTSLCKPSLPTSP